MKQGTKEFVLRLTDLIEQAGDGYSQLHYLHECGTPSCIVGWAVALYNT